jgi:hypothetical protein
LLDLLDLLDPLGLLLLDPLGLLLLDPLASYCWILHRWWLIWDSRVSSFSLKESVIH